VETVLRSGKKTKFLFLRNRDQRAVHHVRLEVTEPGAQTSVSMPQAGAIGLAPGESKVLLADLPLGRGMLRYSTSEVLTTGRLGERVLLVVYGDPESAGEISLQWPGPPLVTGEVTRQAWDPVTSTLVLDYYHGREDRYLLVDELEIIILPRERAGYAATIFGEAGQVLLSAGSAISAGELWPDRLEATVDCQVGVSQVSVALPRRPEAVSVDGTPVEFAFETPQRVARFSLSTSSFESEQRASSVWERARRSVAGGPPGLRLEFDRGWFLPDDEGKPLAWKPKPPNAQTLADLGVKTGGFARLRARFDPQGRTRLVMDGTTDPVLAFVNGRLVPELSGRAVRREADLRDLLSPGENEIVIVMQSLPGQKGDAAVLAGPCLIPAVSLAGEGTGSDGSLPLERWEVSVGLAGEFSGWTGLGLDVGDWHFIRFGPWRKQGRELAGVTGVGWYRVPFGLPHPGAWRIPYQLEVDLGGPAALYLNGEGLATCPGGGLYVVPLSEARVRGGDENVLAAAVYGVGPEAGINRVEIAADREHMTKRRKVEIRF
jgi:hypothetical protein